MARHLYFRKLAFTLFCTGVLVTTSESVQAADSGRGGGGSDEVGFPDLPLLPPVEGLPDVLRGPPSTRVAYVALVRRQAELQGVPPDLADAVAYLESSYNPKAIGAVGEIGLMQIRPQTAAMLGYKGDRAGLFEPDTNARYSVAYLAGAWRHANGDVCRALMKYRTGHRGERMSPLSAAYCARAKSYLAALGSTLGGRASPTAFSKAEAEVAALDPAKRVSPTEETVAQPPKLVSTAPAGRAEAPQAISVAAVATSKPPKLLSTVDDALPPPKSANSMEAATAETTKKQERTFLVLAQEQMEMRKLKGAEYWVAHERRVAAILAALKR